MHETLKGRSAGIDRRHLVAGALGAIALPLACPASARGIETPATEADIGFMRMALEEAALADDPYYFGAVIVHDGKVLARGRNVWNQQQDPTAHGEMVAIRRCLAEHGMEKIKGTTIYTSGESCPMCIAWARLCGAASHGWSMAPPSCNLPPRWVRS
ncbi:MAG TPA: nucleoside deaminase [Methyloceanibacter sp.]|nr:nucleoside deaminase [Methyloceanibacter sp.]